MTEADDGATVEFFGVPGVGKSTLARRASERLAATRTVTEPTYELAHEVSTATRYRGKGRYAASALARRPRRALEAARLIATIDQPSRRTLGKLAFNWLYVDGAVGSRPRGELWVLDQGLVQAVWSVGLGAARDRTPELCRLAVEALSRSGPALVVLVDADPETVRDRLADRSGGDTRLEPDEDSVRAAFALERRVERRLREEVADAPTVDVLRVENESRADLEDGVADVCDRAASLR